MHPDRHHIDEIFRKAFDQHHPKPSPDQWEQAYALLQEIKYRKRKKRLLLLLGILALGTLSAYLIYRTTSTPTHPAPSTPLALQSKSNHIEEAETAPSPPSTPPAQPITPLTPPTKLLAPPKKSQITSHDHRPLPPTHRSSDHQPITTTHGQHPPTAHRLEVSTTSLPVRPSICSSQDIQPIPLPPLPSLQPVTIPTASPAWTHVWHRSYGVALSGTSSPSWEFTGGLESEWSWRKSWHIAIGINAVYLYDGRDRDLIINQPIYGLQKTYRRYSIDLVHINAIAVPLSVGYHFPKFGLRTGIVYHFPFASFGFIKGLESPAPFARSGWIHPKYLNRRFIRLSAQCLIPLRQRRLSFEFQYGKDQYISPLNPSMAPQPLWNLRLGLYY